MEITVDVDKCCGYGDCVIAAPEVFDLGDDGIATVLPGAQPTMEHAMDAADACPVSAIQVDP